MIVSMMTEQTILACFNEVSSFVLQRYEVQVGDPVGSHAD
jgi:hypothetical protein